MRLAWKNILHAPPANISTPATFGRINGSSDSAMASSAYERNWTNISAQLFEIDGSAPPKIMWVLIGTLVV